MNNRRKGGSFLPPLYVFAIIWLFSSIAFPLYELWGLLLTLGLCSLGAFIAGKASAKRALKKEKEAAEAEQDSGAGCETVGQGNNTRCYANGQP